MRFWQSKRFHVIFILLPLPEIIEILLTNHMEYVLLIYIAEVNQAIDYVYRLINANVCLFLQILIMQS